MTVNYQKERREKLKSKGLCVTGCGRPSMAPLVKCEKCIGNDKSRYARKISKGLCAVSGCNNSASEGRGKNCDECRIKRSKKREERRKNGCCAMCGAEGLVSKWTCFKCYCRVKDSRYGLVPGTFGDKFSSIKNCQSCGIGISLIGRNGKQGAHVDHDHKTGVVRGLLCRECNTALGIMNEDSARIRMLADYIDSHKS